MRHIYCAFKACKIWTTSEQALPKLGQVVDLQGPLVFGAVSADVYSGSMSSLNVWAVYVVGFTLIAVFGSVGLQAPIV